jgi:hypothetical protein
MKRESRPKRKRIAGTTVQLHDIAHGKISPSSFRGESLAKERTS